jgi:imidazolonepropionase-like amidohydrolase
LGIDNFTVLKSATQTPSQFLGEDDSWGTVETGKDADLIILNKNPLDDMRNLSTIETVIKNGHIYSQRKLLKSL